MADETQPREILEALREYVNDTIGSTAEIKVLPDNRFVKGLFHFTTQDGQNWSLMLQKEQ